MRELALACFFPLLDCWIAMATATATAMKTGARPKKSKKHVLDGSTANKGS